MRELRAPQPAMCDGRGSGKNSNRFAMDCPCNCPEATHAAGKLFATSGACEAPLARCQYQSPLRCDARARRWGCTSAHVPAMFAEMFSEILIRMQARPENEVTYAEPESRLSDHGLLGWFFVGEEGFQHDVQPASFQKTHADEFHSHAATHMHAANDGARLHLALRRVKK